MTHEEIGNWLTGMRSGDYTWCHGSFQQGDKYCGLAVLLAVHGLPIPSLRIPLEVDIWLDDHMSVRLEQWIVQLNDASYTKYEPIIADVEMAMEAYITR